jgi:hypothetical protein
MPAKAKYADPERCMAGMDISLEWSHHWAFCDLQCAYKAKYTVAVQHQPDGIVVGGRTISVDPIKFDVGLCGVHHNVLRRFGGGVYIITGPKFRPWGYQPMYHTLWVRLPPSEPSRVPSYPSRLPIVSMCAVGQRVFHYQFGAGTVVEVVARSGDQEVAIEFDRRGLKRLMASLARLELVG